MAASPRRTQSTESATPGQNQPSLLRDYRFAIGQNPIRQSPARDRWWKKIKGRKRHIITDTLGHVLGVIVHAANLSDTVEGQRVCLQVADKHPSIQAFAADQGYRGTTKAFVEEWLNRRVDIVEKASPGFQVQPKRWIVERTLAWLGGFRRLAKEFEIRIDTAENMIRIAMLTITLAKCVKL